MKYAENKSRKASIATISFLVVAGFAMTPGATPAMASDSEICIDDAEICFDLLAEFNVAQWTWVANVGPHLDVVDVTLGSCPDVRTATCAVNVESHVSPNSEFSASCSRPSTTESWTGSIRVFGMPFNCTLADGFADLCIGSAFVEGFGPTGSFATGQGSGVIDCIDE